LPGIIGVAGPERRSDMVVVAAALVFIGNDESDGRTGRFALKNAAQHLHGITFLALGHDSALPRSAAIEVVLYEFEVKIQPCRAAVDNAADGGAVRFAEGCDAEEGTESIHGVVFCVSFPGSDLRRYSSMKCPAFTLPLFEAFKVLFCESKGRIFLKKTIRSFPDVFNYKNKIKPWRHYWTFS